MVAVQVLGPLADKKPPVPSAVSLTAVPPELIKDMVDRVKEAVEMGDVSQVSTVAGELKSSSEALAPICDKLMVLADDFPHSSIKCITSPILNEG